MKRRGWNGSWLVHGWGRTTLMASLGLCAVQGCSTAGKDQQGAGDFPAEATGGAVGVPTVPPGAGADATLEIPGGTTDASPPPNAGVTTMPDFPDTETQDPLACPPGQIRCGLSCIDPRVDQNYCGARADCIGANSGRACPGLEQCSNAVCACPPDWVRCNGGCINPKQDLAFCGARLDCAGPNAGIACGSNTVCSDGQCVSGCKTGELLCDGNCIDPLTDFNYCGAVGSCTGAEAGKTCDLGQVCSDGRCTLECKKGEVLCGDRCVDPQSDSAHCGARLDCRGANAGQACQAPNSCVAGTCALNCNSWQIKCDGKCVNPKSDPLYCGARGDCQAGNKGAMCQGDEICSGGRCQQAGCEEVNFAVSLPKSDIMLVIDKSGSMSTEQIQVGSTMTSRWPVLHDVVSDLVRDFGAKVRFGLKLYPAATAVEDSCRVDPGVEVAISETSNASLVPAMPGREATVFGETPTATGMREAVQALVQTAARTANPSALMIIADGGITVEGGLPGDSCDTETEAELLRAADFARASDLQVFSVGINLSPGDANLLKRVAKFEENYLPAENKTMLVDAVTGILNKIPNCKVPLNPVPQYYHLMTVRTSSANNVSFDAPWLFQHANCDAALAAGLHRGYVYTHTSGPYDEIELCGQSCADFKASTKVDIRQECPPPP